MCGVDSDWQYKRNYTKLVSLWVKEWKLKILSLNVDGVIIMDLRKCTEPTVIENTKWMIPNLLLCDKKRS